MRNEINELKNKLSIQDDLSTDKKYPSARQKRQISRGSRTSEVPDSGSKPVVYDKAYGVDLDLKVGIMFKAQNQWIENSHNNTLILSPVTLVIFKSSLHHYPYGYQKWRSSTPNPNDQASANNVVNDQSNQIKHQIQSNQQTYNTRQNDASSNKLQSAYAKVLDLN